MGTSSTKRGENDFFNRKTNFSFNLDNKTIVSTIIAGIVTVVSLLASLIYFTGLYINKIDEIKEAQDKIETNYEKLRVDLNELKVQSGRIDEKVNIIIYGNSSKKNNQQLKGR